jgi:hypothetical protein
MTTQRNEQITADNLRVVQGWTGSWHVFEMRDGTKVLHAWPSPFHSKRAAELVAEDVVEGSAKGIIDTGQCPFRGHDVLRRYGEEARLVGIIEEVGGVDDPRKLAQALMKRDPSQDSEIPF